LLNHSRLVLGFSLLDSVRPVLGLRLSSVQPSRVGNVVFLDSTGPNRVGDDARNLVKNKKKYQDQAKEKLEVSWSKTTLSCFLPQTFQLRKHFTTH
jgi:hypothetical protein